MGARELRENGGESFGAGIELSLKRTKRNQLLNGDQGSERGSEGMGGGRQMITLEFPSNRENF